MQYIDIKANNKYMKTYDKNKESSYIQHSDASNLYGSVMFQKLSVDDFKLKTNMVIFNEDFIKNYDENSDKGQILEVDVKYPQKVHDLHSDLPFLQERMKINTCNKLLCNLYDKKSLRALKQALNHGLITKKVHRVIEFNEKASLKPYIHVNIKKRTEAKMILRKIFLSK